MLKMGDKTLSLVNKALEYATLNIGLVPTYVDMEEARKDNKLTADIYGIFQQLSNVLRGIEDIGMVAGGEAYEAAIFRKMRFQSSNILINSRIKIKATFEKKI